MTRLPLLLLVAACETQRSTAPPSFTLPPPPTGTRTHIANFSVILPDGWNQIGVDDSEVAFIAGKPGTSTERVTTFTVRYSPKETDFETRASCSALGAPLAEVAEGKLEHATLTKVGGAPWCMIHVSSGPRDLLLAYIPDGNRMYVAACAGPSSEKAFSEDCPLLFASWKFDF